MEAFLGTWKLESSENFDDYMKTVGVSFMTRKVGATLKPNYIIAAEEDETFNLRMESTFKNHDMRFKLDQEFDETTSDGRKCKTLMKLEGSKLIQDQKGEVPSLITRELKDNNTLVCICSANGVESTRVYKRA